MKFGRNDPFIIEIISTKFLEKKSFINLSKWTILIIFKVRDSLTKALKPIGDKIKGTLKQTTLN